MRHTARGSIAGTVLLCVLALTGCAGDALGTPSTGSEISAAVPLLKYSFKVQNETDYEVTLHSNDIECMLKTLDGKLHPHQTQDVEVETKSGPGCEDRKESYFTTSFSKNARGDYVDYRFVKHTLSAWKLEHRHDGPKSTLVVYLTNEFAFTRVKIEKLR